MYPPKFDYVRAGSVSEALAMMAQHEDAKLLAGGHSLIPTLKLRLASPATLIDIGRCSELSGINSGNGTSHIGALTTHAMVHADGNLPAALTEAAGWIGDPQVRNKGTVGGNIAHADPASDLPTVLTALGATIHMVGPNGERSVSSDDFFIDLFETALQEDEIVTAISVSNDGGSGSAYAKLFNPASRYAIVGVAAKISASGGSCDSASVAIGGLTAAATRCSAVEAALTGQPLNADTIAAAAEAVAGDLGGDVMGDIHASEDYRRAMAPVYVERALTAAAERVS